MKTFSPMNLSYRQEFRFPLDLVASTAARLLEGENYQEAARRALKLLEACDTELTSDAVAAMAGPGEQLPARAAAPAIPQSGLPACVPFQRMLKHITGKDGAKARKDYADFLRWYMRREKVPYSYCPDVATEEAWMAAQVAALPEPAAHEVNARMKKEAERTFPRAEVESWTVRFNAWKKRETSKVAAERGRKGGRPKKKLG